MDDLSSCCWRLWCGSIDRGTFVHTSYRGWGACWPVVRWPRGFHVGYRLREAAINGRLGGWRWHADTRSVDRSLISLCVRLPTQDVRVGSSQKGVCGWGASSRSRRSGSPASRRGGRIDSRKRSTISFFLAVRSVRRRLLHTRIHGNNVYYYVGKGLL